MKMLMVKSTSHGFCAVSWSDVFLNEHYGLFYTKLHYIGPVESIFEGLEILEVLSEELKLPGLKGLCLEPT